MPVHIKDNSSDKILALELKPIKLNIQKVDITSPPNIDFLTDEQKIAFDNCRRFFNGRHGKCHMVLGSAGTGKTTLITMLVHLILHKTNMRVCIASPTHKAVKITRKLSPFTTQFREFENDRNKVARIDHSRVHYSTVHSLIGWKQFIDENGKEKYGPNTYMEGQEPINNFDTIIVDEDSWLETAMVDELLSWKDIVNIIFVGDMEQIPPINMKGTKGGVSVIFDKSYHDFHDIRSSTLATVMRQALDNPVLAMATSIRLGEYKDRAKNTVVSDTGGVYYLDRRDQDIDTILIKYFGSDSYAKDTDYVKILAYYKDTVELWNHRVRKLLYADRYPNGHLPILIPGETIITKSSIVETDPETGEKIIKHPNFSELRIVKVTPTTMSLIKAIGGNNEAKFTYYHTEVEYVCDSTGQVLSSTCKILHEDEQADYAAFMQEWKERALRLKRAGDKSGARMSFMQYYSFTKMFVNFTYSHACTVHRSMGSSFDTSIILEYDIDKINRSRATDAYHRKVFYTACSRAITNNIIIL